MGLCVSKQTFRFSGLTTNKIILIFNVIKNRDKTDLFNKITSDTGLSTVFRNVPLRTFLFDVRYAGSRIIRK